MKARHKASIKPTAPIEVMMLARAAWYLSDIKQYFHANYVKECCGCSVYYSLPAESLLLQSMCHL